MFYLKRKQEKILTLAYWVTAILMLWISCILLICGVGKIFGFILYIISMTMIVSPLVIWLIKIFKNLM